MCALYIGLFRYQCQLDGEVPLDEKPFWFTVHLPHPAAADYEGCLLIL